VFTRNSTWNSASRSSFCKTSIRRGKPEVVPCRSSGV
jgi:hypothetical protein